jgi:hypothetical protein
MATGVQAMGRNVRAAHMKAPPGVLPAAAHTSSKAWINGCNIDLVIAISGVVLKAAASLRQRPEQCLRRPPP